jgi:hypothetical protein
MWLKAAVVVEVVAEMVSMMTIEMMARGYVYSVFHQTMVLHLHQLIQTQMLQILEMMERIVETGEIAQTLATAIVETLAIHLIHRMIVVTVETLAIQVTVETMVMAEATVAEMEMEMEEIQVKVTMEEETEMMVADIDHYVILPGGRP